MSSTRTKRTARRGTADPASPIATGIAAAAAESPQSPNGTLGLLLGLAEATSLTQPMQTTSLPAPAQSHPTAIASLQPSATGAPVISSYTTLARPPFPAATTYSSILSQRPVASAASSHTKAATLFSNPLNASASHAPSAVSYTSVAAPLSSQQLDDSLRASLTAKVAAKSNAAAAAAAAAVAAASSSTTVAPIHASYPVPAQQQTVPLPQQSPVASPIVPVAAAGAAPATATKPVGRRQKNSAAVTDAAVPPSKAEKVSRGSASSSSAAGSHHSNNNTGFEAVGGGHVDKQKKRLLRKAELARASRRRKKAYVGDLESKCAQLIAQSGFLLSLINKTPAMLAAIRYDQRLPAGLSFEPTTGLLKCHIDVQREVDGSDGELDGDSGADSDAEAEATGVSYEASPSSKLDHASVAPSVAPSDLVVLAHAMTEVGASSSSSSLNETPVASPGLVQSPHAPPPSSVFIPVSSPLANTTSSSSPIPSQHSAAASAIGLPVSPPTTVMIPQTTSDHVVIKCSFRGEWRRFTIPAAQFTFPHLQQTLHHLLLSDSVPSSSTITSSPSSSSLIIKYVDDQGDEILIRSTAELLDARQFSETLIKDEPHTTARAANDCLRLYVTEASPNVAASTASVVPSTPVPPSASATQNHKRKSVEPDLQAFVKSEVGEEKMMDDEKKVATPVAKESLSKRAKLEAAAAN